MPTKRLWLFCSFVALVVGYAIIDYQSEQREAQTKSEKALLFAGKWDQVQRFEMKSDKANFVLVRSDAGWKFEAPIQETADQDTVTQFIEGISTEKSTAVAAEGETIDWKIYGLDRPTATVSLKDNLGSENIYHLSAKKNFQGETYLRHNEDKKVLVVAATWLQKASKIADDFRDRRWARINAADIEGVTFTKGTEEVELAKKDINWIATKKSTWKLDQNKVRRFISGISVNRIQNFLIRPDSKPLASLELRLKDNKTWVGHFGINRDKKHFIQVSAANLNGEVLTDDANELFRTTLDSLRDRTEPFQVRKDDVRKISFQTSLKKFSAEFKNDKWELASGEDASREIDSGKLTDFLGKLQSFELLDFVDKRADKNDEAKIATDGARLILKTADEKVLLDLCWGGLSKVKSGGLEKAVYLAKTSNYPLLFTMEDEKFKTLGLDQIVVDKKVDTPQNKSEVKK